MVAFFFVQIVDYECCVQASYTSSDNPYFNMIFLLNWWEFSTCHIHFYTSKLYLALCLVSEVVKVVTEKSLQLTVVALFHLIYKV